jgi:hypothetical protein
MTDIAPLNQGRFYWVLVRSSTKDPEWQPARFTGAAGHSPAAKWDFIGFNRDVGHHFVEIADIGPELDEGPLEVRGGARRAADGFLIKPGSARWRPGPPPPKRKERTATKEPQMSTRMQSRSRKSGAAVMHWFMFALSLLTIAWISFPTIGG